MVLVVSIDRLDSYGSPASRAFRVLIRPTGGVVILAERVAGFD